MYVYCNGYVVNCVLYAWIVLKAFAGVSIICRTTDQCYCLCDNIDVHLGVIYWRLHIVCCGLNSILMHLLHHVPVGTNPLNSKCVKLVLWICEWFVRIVHSSM